MGKADTIMNVYTILYTRTIPKPLMHQIYTPFWTKTGSGASLCLEYSEESPPPHTNMLQFHRLQPSFDADIKSFEAQSLSPR